MINVTGRLQRYRNGQTCPICGGYEALRRRKNERCYGYISPTGKWAVCTREEYAGTLPYDMTQSGYVHRLSSPCPCGQPHAEPNAYSAAERRNGHAGPPSRSRASGDTIDYELRDVAGQHIATHHRRNKPGGDKGMWYTRPDRDPKKGLDGLPRDSLPLYRIQDVAALAPGARVVVTEGEKCALALIGVGVAAVGTATGAPGTPDDSALAPLVPFRVVLWPDNDDVGMGHMERIGVALRRLGCIDVRVVRWADAPPKGDAADLIHRYGAGAELESVLAAAEAQATQPSESGAASGIISYADIERTYIRWLSPRRLPRGKITLFCGDPGLGKSLLGCTIAALISSGGTWPDGVPCEPAPVVLCCIEDDDSDTVKPRLEAAGADVARVHPLRDVPEAAGPRPLALPGDVAYIRDKLIATGAQALILDPLLGLLGLQLDSYKDQHVRAGLMPLASMAAELGVAVIGVLHLNKKDGGNALYRIGGSIALAAVARVALLVCEDPEDTSRRLLLPLKNNLSAPARGLAFRVEDDSAYDIGRIVWDGFSDVSAKQALAGAADDDDDRGALAEAQAFLRDALAAGPRHARDMQRDARAAGIAEPTLRRAKHAMGIKSRKAGDVWLWIWPALQDVQDDQDDQGSHDDHDTDSVAVGVAAPEKRSDSRADHLDPVDHLDHLDHLDGQQAGTQRDELPASGDAAQPAKPAPLWAGHASAVHAVNALLRAGELDQAEAIMNAVPVDWDSERAELAWKRTSGS